MVASRGGIACCTMGIHAHLTRVENTRPRLGCPAQGLSAIVGPFHLSRVQSGSPGGESAKHTPPTAACRAAIDRLRPGDDQNPIKDDPCQNQISCLNRHARPFRAASTNRSAPSMGSAARPASSITPMAPISMMWMVSATSTTSALGDL